MRTVSLLAAALLAASLPACSPDEEFIADQTSPALPAAENTVRVIEYMPAPGQFINEGFTAVTQAEAVEWASARLSKGYYVSLGAWGGYIVVGFSRTVPCTGGYDLLVRGNAIDQSSEPGIVYVMEDSNGNGLPDDVWYELRGSEFGKETHTTGYSVTYFRPDSPSDSIMWTDSLGETGTVDRIDSHSQDTYYPKWVSGDSYTLSGSLLKANNTCSETGYWTNAPYGWGYADNCGSDFSKDGSNRLRISDAVRSDGTPAGLRGIDFVRVQTGTNAKSGPLGENSTEVLAVRDISSVK